MFLDQPISGSDHSLEIGNLEKETQNCICVYCHTVFKVCRCLGIHIQLKHGDISKDKTDP